MWNWFFAISTISRAACGENLAFKQREGWENDLWWADSPLLYPLTSSQPDLSFAHWDCSKSWGLPLYQGWQGLWQSCCPQVPHRHSWWLQRWCPRCPSKGKESSLGTGQNIISPVLLASEPLAWPPPGTGTILPIWPSLLGTAFSPKSQSVFVTDFNRNWIASRCSLKSFPFHYSLAEMRRGPTQPAMLPWSRYHSLTLSGTSMQFRPWSILRTVPFNIEN